MFKIRKGNTRLAFIFFNYLVVKIPNPRLDFYRGNFRSGGILRLLRRTPHHIYFALLHGITANISEGLIYFRAKSNYCFLEPVFTLGIFNFQRYRGDSHPTGEQVAKFLSIFSGKNHSWLWESDSHEKSENNWRMTDKGLRVIDYAADPCRSAWGSFLVCSQREFYEKTNPQG